MGKLFQDSGSTGVQRRDEARRLLNIIQEDFDRMSTKDANFTADIETRLQSDGFEPSPAQLFWLRDLRDRLL